MDVRARFVLAAALILLNAALDAAAAESAGVLLAQIESAHRQNYDSLERAPIRGWGELNQLRPLNDLQHALRNPVAGRQGRPPSGKSVPERFNSIYTAFVEQLHLTPAGEIRVGDVDGISVKPSAIKVTAFVDVPTALVLRVQARNSKQPVVISPVDHAGVEIKGETLTPAGSPALYAVLPLIATGEPGRRELTFQVSSGGRQARIPLFVDVKSSGRLTGSVCAMEDDTSAPLAAKLFVEDAAGRLYVAPGAPNYTTQNWYGTWLPRFTCADGDFDVPLPPGKYRVTAMKGPGYADFVGEVEVQASQSASLPVRMQRLWPLEQRGWLCADMHTHARGIPLTMMRAEDVNVVARTFYSSNKPYALGIDTANSDVLHLSAENQEIEHWNFGNVFFFDIPTSVQDPDHRPVEMTPMFHYDGQAHEMGGITLRYMRARPFRPQGGGQAQPELAVSAALGLVDVWTVMENSVQNLLGDPRNRWSGRGWPDDRIYANTYLTWYALANCGLRIPIAAGTSYGRLSRLGFNRVYARHDGELTTASWARALVRGDGFVTNGPLLWLRVNDRLPGDGLALDSPGRVKVYVQLVSHRPVRLVEILQNGKVVASRELDTNTSSQQLEWEEFLPVDNPCWFAARCFGETDVRYPHQTAPNQFAHTNMLMVTVAGRRPRSAECAARFVEEIDALIKFAPNIPSDSMRQRALTLYNEARQYFASQTDDRLTSDP